MSGRKLYFNWSSGKDSALSLFLLLNEPGFDVNLLLTTINMQQDRISMHGIRRNLLIDQCKNIGLPYKIIELPETLTIGSYDSIMNNELKSLQKEKYEYAGFGDILLEDIKKYREEQIGVFDIQGVFPLWGKNTLDVANEFIGKGFKAIVVSINANLLDKSFCGRILDKDFINDLPSGVDPCGENGEFHTFCFDGPIFKKRVPFTTGEIIYKEYKAPKDPEKIIETSQNEHIGFWFCDLLSEDK